MSEPGGTTTLDWAGIIGASVLVLGAIGSAFKWLFGRADRREERQQKREDAYVEKIEERLAALEKRIGELWTCFNLVTHALHSQNPIDPALQRAADILGDAFPINLNTPADMQDALRRMDGMAPQNLWKDEI